MYTKNKIVFLQLFMSFCCTLISLILIDLFNNLYYIDYVTIPSEYRDLIKIQKKIPDQYYLLSIAVFLFSYIIFYKLQKKRQKKIDDKLYRLELKIKALKATGW